MVSNIFYVSLFIIAVWLTILSIVFWQMYNHYNTLTKDGTQTKGLKSLLEDIIRELEKQHSNLDFLKKKYDKIEEEEKLHIQKVGLRRFNPFKDTGGDQSFIVSLLDANNTGILISGLYSRTGTRWYTKQILKGKGVDHELSDEEQKALQEVNILKEDKHE